MKNKSILKLISETAGEERTLINFREIPCKDMDLDCLALDGKIPFDDYRKCYEYAPELGRCMFYNWNIKKG